MPLEEVLADGSSGPLIDARSHRAPSNSWFYHWSERPKLTVTGAMPQPVPQRSDVRSRSNCSEGADDTPQGETHGHLSRSGIVKYVAEEQDSAR